MQNYSGSRFTLHSIEMEKELGTSFEPTLKFSVHVANTVNKANQFLGLIRRSFTYIDLPLMKHLYIALKRPHLEFGNVVWHRMMKKDIQLLEKVQHRATKIIPSLCRMSYEDRLKAIHLPSLIYRRLQGDAIETFNIFTVFTTWTVLCC